MADETYIVELRLDQVGQDPKVLRPATEARLRSMDDRFSKIKRGISDMSTGGAKFADAMDFAAQKVFSVAKWGAIIGGGGFLVAAKIGVMDLNAQLEATRISLGTIFSAQGKASDLNQGLSMASSLILQMRKDAALLPGEFGDLLQFFRTGAIPAFQAGASVDQWRELSSKAMAAAAATALPMDMAARELAQLIGGRAGAHNVFGMRLLGLSGDAAKEFNQLAPEERLAKTSEALDKYSASIDVFGKSWEGLTSTFVDGLKEFTRRSTEGLFGKLKDQFQAANAWIDRNQEDIDYYADIISMRLGEAFDFGKRKLLEWGPVFADFAGNTLTKMRDVWQDIEPTVGRVAGHVKDMLRDPGTIDKLITLGRIYAGVKAFQVGAGIVGAVGSMGRGARAMGAGLGGAAVGAMAGGALGATQSVETMGLGALAGSLLGPLIVKPIASLLTKAQMLIGLGGGMGALTSGAGAAASHAMGLLTAHLPLLAADVIAWGLALDQGLKLWDELGTVISGDEDAIRSAIARRVESEQKLNASNEQISVSLTSLAESFALEGNAMAEAMTLAEVSVYSFKAAVDSVTAALFARKDVEMSQIADDAMAVATAGTTRMVQDFIAEEERKKNRKGAKHGGGGGGTKIQKVEIVVTSNQNPSRIARDVVDEIAKLNRMRKSSRFVQNFSTLGGKL